MKRIALLALIFIAAIAISPMLIGEKGYILIAMGDYTVESTVVTAGMLLFVTFMVLLITLKVFKGGLHFSVSAWHKVRYASKRKAYRQFQQGIASYVLGDNQQAEHLLVKSAEPTEFTQTAYLLAASAADKQGLKDNTQHYLKQISDGQLAVKETGLESVLITLRLLLNHNDKEQARALLDKYHKYIGHDHRMLALEIELSLLEKRYFHVVEKLNNARKQHAISAQQISQWEQQAFLGAFEQKITEHDQQALYDYWNTLSRKLKQRDEVVMAYCHVLAKHGINEPLSKILLPLVKKGSNEYQLKKLRLLPLTAVDELIVATQKHLHHNQHSATWLRTLAHLATKNKQWDKAEKAFNALMHLEGEPADKLDLLTFAQVLETLNKPEQAIAALRKAATMA